MLWQKKGPISELGSCSACTLAGTLGCRIVMLVRFNNRLLAMAIDPRVAFWFALLSQNL